MPNNERLVAQLQEDLNARDQALDDVATENNERELSRRDWFEEARRLEKEVEELRNDLVTFKGCIYTLGEAAKKLCFNARTSGGTPGPDQALMDACGEVEHAISLVGVSRAIDYVEGLGAENKSLKERYEAARDRKNSITALKAALAERDALLRAAQQFVENWDDDSQEWMDLSSSISNALSASAEPTEGGAQ